jgi:hypothetical protein
MLVIRLTRDWESRKRRRVPRWQKMAIAFNQKVPSWDQAGVQECILFYDFRVMVNPEETTHP